MNLRESLTQISDNSSIPLEELMEYSVEDGFSGCEAGYWSPISVSKNEGIILYCLVRALKPRFAVEVGSNSGCSTTHILAAMDKNKIGTLFAVDIDGIIDPGVPYHLIERLHEYKANAREWLWPERVDFLFEDGDHTRDFTEMMVKKAHNSGAKCIVCHDALNASVGELILGGCKDANIGDFHIADVDGPKLGLAYWFRKEE